jgi:CheY-like chemotaxis protein
MCNNQNISVVFMDIRMPVLNGFEAYERLKYLEELPVIAQTAYSSFEDKEKIMKMGFVDCITKHMDKEKL